jgi:hypothetical protein
MISEAQDKAGFRADQRASCEATEKLLLVSLVSPEGSALTPVEKPQKPPLERRRI